MKEEKQIVSKEETFDKLEIRLGRFIGVLNFEPRQIGDTTSEVLVLGVQYPKAESGEATFIAPFAEAKTGGKLF